MTVASPRPRPGAAGPSTDFRCPVDAADVSTRSPATRGPTGWRPTAGGVRGLEALPAETNLLYTPYIDLRGAQLAADARLVTDRDAPSPARCPTTPTACSSDRGT